SDIDPYASDASSTPTFGRTARNPVDQGQSHPNTSRNSGGSSYSASSASLPPTPLSGCRDPIPITTAAASATATMSSFGVSDGSSLRSPQSPHESGTHPPNLNPPVRSMSSAPQPQPQQQQRRPSQQHSQHQKEPHQTPQASPTSSLVQGQTAGSSGSGAGGSRNSGSSAASGGAGGDSPSWDSMDDSTPLYGTAGFQKLKQGIRDSVTSLTPNVDAGLLPLPPNSSIIPSPLSQEPYSPQDDPTPDEMHAQGGGTVVSPSSASSASASTAPRDTYLPLIPTSPLVHQHHQMSQQYNSSCERLKEMQNIRGPVFESSANLAQVRRLVENISVLRDRISNVSLQINQAAAKTLMDFNPKALALQLTVYDKGMLGFVVIPDLVQWAASVGAVDLSDPMKCIRLLGVPIPPPLPYSNPDTTQTSSPLPPPPPPNNPRPPPDDQNPTPPTPGGARGARRVKGLDEG
ncbi:hypothetical protein HK102_011048, partial [Quaeritorhiza haematococci]